MARNEHDMNDNTEITPNDQNVAPPAPLEDNGGNPPVTVTPAAGNDDPEFAGMNERERALVKKARAEEKRKLYQDLERLKETNRTLNAQLRELQTAPPPRTPEAQDSRDERIDRVFTALEQVNNRISEIGTRFDQMQEEEVSRRREADVRRYRAERIAALRAEGQDVVEGLVMGNSEEEIDMAIDIARAEYQLIAMKEEKKRGRVSPPNVRVSNPAPNGRSGAPPIMAPNHVEADSTTENISDLTSDVAVRNGTYEAKRTELLGKLKRNYRYGGQA